MKKLFTSLLATFAILSAVAISPALAEYPEKPVEFIVPFPPGDLEDILTRMIAENFQKKYGTPAAVVNKPGGGGGPFPGAIYVAKAPADGYTIGSFVIAVPTIGHKIGIAELAPAQFDPLGIFLTYPFVIASSKSAPYSDIDGLAAYAKSNDVTLGHFGGPLPPTQVTLALAKSKGFSFASDAAFDVLDCNTLASGDVDVMNTTLQLILPCMDKVNILASIGDQRIPLTPNTPTVSELVPEISLALWNGLFVKKGTPADVRAKIIAVAKETVMSKRAQDLAKSTGALIYWKDVAASKAQIASDQKAQGAIAGILK